VAHVAKAGLAQQVLHAGVAQLGDLVAHSRRRAIERPVANTYLTASSSPTAGSAQGFSIARSIVKSAGLYAARTCIM